MLDNKNQGNVDGRVLSKDIRVWHICSINVMFYTQKEVRNQALSQQIKHGKTSQKTFSINIPNLPEAFLTFASKGPVGPSYVTSGQEDHKTYIISPLV